MQNQQDLKIQEALTRIYGALNFASDEIKAMVNDLAGVQQLAASVELLRSLTEDELAELNKSYAIKSAEERKAIIEEIAKAHIADDDFKVRAKAAAKKVLGEHIAYLKTRGNNTQKEKIAAILGEIG